VANRKALLPSLAAVLLLAVLAVAVARDRPPTLFPYPGRFAVAMAGNGQTNSADALLLDRWTGRVYRVEEQFYFELRDARQFNGVK
jgi:hypothetical protein